MPSGFNQNCSSPEALAYCAGEGPPVTGCDCANSYFCDGPCQDCANDPSSCSSGKLAYCQSVCPWMYFGGGGGSCTGDFCCDKYDKGFIRVSGFEDNYQRHIPASGPTAGGMGYITQNVYHHWSKSLTGPSPTGDYGWLLVGSSNTADSSLYLKVISQPKIRWQTGMTSAAGDMLIEFQLPTDCDDKLNMILAINSFMFSSENYYIDFIK